MTALELADYITVNKIRTVTIDMVANMLRNQQAEIEELKEALKNIIVISDRKHDAWDNAKELLKKASEK